MPKKSGNRETPLVTATSTHLHVGREKIKWDYIITAVFDMEYQELQGMPFYLLKNQKGDADLSVTKAGIRIGVTMLDAAGNDWDELASEAITWDELLDKLEQTALLHPDRLPDRLRAVFYPKGIGALRP
jgi:hypothetical protein